MLDGKQMLFRRPVPILAVLLVACWVSVAVAADSNTNATSVARTDGVSGRPIAAHPFVNVKAIQAAGTKIFLTGANNVVNIYNTNGKLLGQITGFTEPQALATDAKANLYVANTGANNVLIYSPPYNKTPVTLSASGWYPAGVAPFNNGEFVAVTNILNTSGGPGSVLLYKRNKLVATVQNSRFFTYIACAFDANGDLFVDGAYVHDGHDEPLVGEIPGATKGKTTLNVLTTENSIEFPGGVQVTTKNEIAIDDQEAYAIYTYNQPKDGSLGSPIATTPLSGSGDPVTFVFTQNNQDLWIADASNQNGVAEYAYPDGGNPVKTLPLPAGGIAIVPAQIP